MVRQGHGFHQGDLCGILPRITVEDSDNAHTGPSLRNPGGDSQLAMCLPSMHTVDCAVSQN